jgi:hypothetical protein
MPCIKWAPLRNIYMTVWWSGKQQIFFSITAVCWFEALVQACEKSKIFICVSSGVFLIFGSAKIIYWLQKLQQFQVVMPRFLADFL